MKVISRQPSKLKELLCVLFGHRWDEYGSKICHEHHETFDESNTCSRCGLENHTNSYCFFCYDRLFGKKQ